MSRVTNPPRRVTIIEAPVVEVNGEQLEQSQPQQSSQPPRSQFAFAASNNHREAKFRESWKVPARYQVKQLLGYGSYGNVSAAYDCVQKKSVAIKQAKHLLDDLVDAKRILREVAILGNLSHPNICRIYDIVVPADLLHFNEIYMVLEMCDSDLRKLCRAEVILEPLHVTILLYHLVVGLNYLHSAGIWHRDLKPANCLVNEDCCVKICDFGLSRAMGSGRAANDLDASGRIGSARNLTGHVVTRWYRAPELILLQESYTEAIDVWSVGCIYAELLGMLKETSFRDRAPLFPGQSCYPLSPHEAHKTDAKYYTKGALDQLSMICNLLGTPSDADIQQIEGADARHYMRSFPKREGSGVKAKFAHVGSEGSDLLERMLVFTAAKRITVAMALKHPVFCPVRVRSRETEAQHHPAWQPLSLEFERDEKLDKRRLRKYFLREVRKFHPEVPHF